MTAITTPTAIEIREFYPVSKSIPTDKLEEVFNHVKNITFLEMFGFLNSAKIISGEIPDNSSASFIGFQKFTALCCAYEIMRDPLVSTNFGTKIIDRQGTINPTNNQKSITLIPLEKAISTHYRTAISKLLDFGCGEVPNWGGYFSYKIHKL